jgi:preprotein translocase subunit SecE
MKKIVQYFKDSYNELVHKVSWPTRTELSNSAVIVLFASIIIALVVSVVDFVFKYAMRFVYEQI